jgi:four helix bundle protein
MEGSVKRFEELNGWQKSRELVREVYKTCQDGQLKRDFGLRDQLCRAAVSSMSNIAEGFARKNDREFARFLDIAKGSVTEVQSLLYVSLDAGYIERGEFNRLYKLAGEAASLITGLTSYLRQSRSDPRRKESPKSGVRGPA